MAAGRLSIRFAAGETPVEVSSPEEAGELLARRWVDGPVTWSAILLRDGRYVRRADPDYVAVIDRAKARVLDSS